MEVRERVIIQATKMFFESGVKAVRMDDIAAACGISKRTLYEHFADREELIRQSLLYYHHSFEQAARERMESSANILEEFRLVFWHSSELKISFTRVVKDLMKFYPGIFDDFIKEQHRKLIENNKERFERGISEGFILDNIDTGFMARTLTSYLYGLKKDFEDYDLSQLEDNKENGKPFFNAIMYFFRGLATEKGREYIDEYILTISNAEDKETGKITNN